MLLLLLAVVSCETPPEVLKVRYDDRRDLYIVDSGEKKGTVLRDKHTTIIREVSDKDSIIRQYNEHPEILNQLPLKFENMSIFVRPDYTITSLYFSCVKELNKKNYITSLELFKKAVKKYPDIIYYSDILFLMGYCYEKMGDPENAKVYYHQFIDKSEQKYSIRFNEISRVCPDEYRDQLEYSRHYLNQEPAGFDESFTKNMTAKYYNNYHYPGFTVGLRPGFSSLGITILPNFEKIEKSYMYLGMSYTFNNWLDAGGSIGFPYPFFSELSVDFQLLKTKNRRFGISLETFLFYIYREEIMVKNAMTELDPPLHFFNAALQCGTGFYILPDLFIGGYYQYYLYNQYYKFHFESSDVLLTTWNTNSYRITLRYLPLKIADLDVSFWNNELYLGSNVYIYTYTLFIGYAILENKFVMKLNSTDIID